MPHALVAAAPQELGLEHKPAMLLRGSAMDLYSLQVELGELLPDLVVGAALPA